MKIFNCINILWVTTYCLNYCVVQSCVISYSIRQQFPLSMGKEEFIYLVIKKLFVLEIINAAKGQLISKGLFKFIFLTKKNQTILFMDFCPKKRLDQKTKGNLYH